MKVCIVESDQREVWDRILQQDAGEHACFLQSWEWGQMQELYGRQVYHFFLKKEEQIIGLMLGIIMPLPLGRSYLLSPRGPVLLKSAGEVKDILEDIVSSQVFAEMVKKESIIFWRLEPLQRFFQDSSKMKQVHDVQPATTSMIDLSSSETELMAVMKQKTRYNVRLAEKKGVRVEFISCVEEQARCKAVEDFYKLVSETNQRHGIRSHSQKYYQAMADTLGVEGILEFAAAYHEDDLLAMNVLIKYGDTVTYLHGAATHLKKNVMAPYLLQWRSIQRSREQGFGWYDFYGISPEDNSQHQLAGVTRFKKGFGGNTLNYPGTFQFPISFIWYKIYQIIKRFS